MVSTLPSVLEQLKCDAVISGVVGGGSSAPAAVQVSIAAEEQGLPSASIICDGFVTLSSFTAAGSGGFVCPHRLFLPGPRRLDCGAGIAFHVQLYIALPCPAPRSLCRRASRTNRRQSVRGRNRSATRCVDRAMGTPGAGQTVAARRVPLRRRRPGGCCQSGPGLASPRSGLGGHDCPLRQR